MLQACPCAMRITAGGASIDFMPCRLSSADPCPQHGECLDSSTPVWPDFCAQSITAYYYRCKHGAVLLQATSAAASVGSQKTGGSNQALESLPQVDWPSLVLVQMCSVFILSRKERSCSNLAEEVGLYGELESKTMLIAEANANAIDCLTLSILLATLHHVAMLACTPLTVVPL